jgi:hypothetical protein
MTDIVLRRKGGSTFAELIIHIVESQRANPRGVVFKLVDFGALFEKGVRFFSKY